MYHNLGRFAAGVQQKIEAIFDYLLTHERQNLLHWLPVGLGVGIGAYFALPVDPPSWVSIAVALISGILCLLCLKSRVWLMLFASLLVMAIGFSLIQQRTYSLATPMLHKPLDKPIKLVGRVIAVEQQPMSMRLTLDDLSFNTKETGQHLKKIRIVARGSLIPKDALYPGQYVRVIAMLLPPRRPVMAGAYDFRRKAYFDGIGAVGYVVTPPKLSKHRAERTLWKRWEEGLAALRHHLTLVFRQNLPGQAGEIAAALVTGDRSGITDETRQQFADSGIAHILAISGLHLSIISGLAFLVVRGGLSFVPPLSLRFPIKKIAAIFAIIATSLYLFICGATIPAQRAKIQTTIILGAVLIDRQAITLRNVALAAMFILILLPESLISVSFQLSFAAVVALIAGYQALQPHFSRWHGQDNSFVKRMFIYLLGISCSSVLATAATLPFTVFTFHKFTLTAVLTNLIAIPLVTFAIMPLLLIFLMCVPLSLQGWISPLLMGAIELMMRLAAEVSTWSASLIQVPAFSTPVLLLCIAGMLWLCLWTTKIRLWGLVPMGLSLLFTCFVRPPDLFINEDGTLVALRDLDGKALVNTLQAGRFARKCWSEHGAHPTVVKLSDRGACSHVSYEIHSNRIMHMISKRYVVDVTLDPGLTNIDYKIKITDKSGRLISGVTVKDLMEKGGHSLWFERDGVKMKTVQAQNVQKPWNLNPDIS